jgi:hypothetical protein
MDTLANYNVSKTLAETQQAEQRAKLLREQRELLRQQTEALRLENEQRRRQLSDASKPQPDLDKSQSSTTAAPGTQEQTIEKFRERMLEARRKHPDFDAVTSREDVVLSPAMIQAVMESESGGELMYYFGQHADECRRIAALSPTSAILAIGKLEAKLAKPEN